MESDATAEQLALLWQRRDFAPVVNRPTAQLMHLDGDWDLPADVTPSLPLIRLAIGVPDGGTFPREELGEAFQAVMARPGDDAFVYGFGPGYTPLRTRLAAWYSRERGLPVTEDWFQLTNGSSGAIDLVCRCLIEPGDVILCESPTYMGTLRNFRGLLAEVHSVAMDEQGLCTDQLEARILDLRRAGRKIKLIYTISTFQNPTGRTLSLARRRELLAIAARYDILVLDDAAYGELHFDEGGGPTLSALAGGMGVVTVGTLSKVLSPGLRIGWIHAEPSLVRLFGKMRFAMGLNQMMVRAVDQLLEDNWLDRHLARVRGLYQRKMNTVADALTQRLGTQVSFQRPRGGFYLWVDLQGLSARQVWRTAVEEGVAITPGVNFHPERRDPAGEHVRIAYSWTPIDQLEEGVARFARAFERVHDGRPCD